eukprot:3553733-Amphidinium_carterae.1
MPAEKLDHAGLDEVIAIIRAMGGAPEKGEVTVMDVQGQLAVAADELKYLPVGATGSVYDLMEPMVTADSASKAVEALSHALGWLYDAERAKLQFFAQSAVVLGAALEIR